jgi:hypothetical protein
LPCVFERRDRVKELLMFTPILEFGWRRVYMCELSGTGPGIDLASLLMKQ